MKPKVYIYDLEVYQNFFSAVFYNYTTGSYSTFLISDVDGTKHNQLKALYEVLKHDAFFVGYNNTEYDNQLLEYIYVNFLELSEISSTEICKRLFELSVSIINKGNREYRYFNNLKYFDLMRLGGGDGLRKSLKSCMCNLRHELIQDLPISWDEPINSSAMHKLIPYCVNDVNGTKKLFDNLIGEVQTRIEASKMFGINLLNETRSTMANKILEKLYSEKSGDKISELKKEKNNIRNVFLKDVIFDDIEFSDKELNEFLDKLKGLQIDCSKDKITLDESMSVLYDEITYEFGAGGLHSKDTGFYATSDDKYIIKLCDVGSYYPTLMIKKGIKPSQLKKAFIDVLKELTNLRLKYKKEGNKLWSSIYKIVINSIFGKMGSKHSWLYDPEAMLKVTINGQLYLLMLVEWLTKNGLTVVSANTDGIVCMIPREKEVDYHIVCEAWEDFTKLSLDFKEYETYARANVNNYLAVESGTKEVETKGEFNPNLYKDVSKGYDSPIVAIAIYNYYVKKVPIADTITNHKDILDFCKAPQSSSKFNVLYMTPEKGSYNIEKLQKTNRYYVSRTGGRLVKQEKGKDSTHSFERNRLVTILNNYDPKTFKIEDARIDYQYYITQANRIKESVGVNQLSLWL